MYRQRVKIFLGIIVLLLVVMLARLLQLQVGAGGTLHGDDANILPTYRGTIYDRGGKILAIDEPCHDFCLEYGFIAQDAKWVRRQQKRIAADLNVGKEEAERIYNERCTFTWRLAAELTDQAGDDLREICDRITRRVEHLRRMADTDVREQREAHPIVRGLDDAAHLAVDEKMGQTVGASLEASHGRRYPYGALACHIIGLTGPVTKEEQDRFNLSRDQADWLTRELENYRDSDALGKSGVEKMCEKELRGRRGYQWFGRQGEMTASAGAIPGGDVRLSIDIDLQARLEALLTSKGYTGCIVVLSVPKGEVLAMVSVPTYDLNTYRRKYRELSDDPNTPMIHRAVARCYPPGSTAKAIAALSGLASRTISESTEFECHRYFLDSDHDHFKCWHPYGHGRLAVTQALKQSCNVFFYTLGGKMGCELMAEWFGLFGFGEVPGTHLPEEVEGALPTAEAIYRRWGRAPAPSDAWLTPIGQGPITATPLQVANGMATIARGGVFQSPTVVVQGADRPVVQRNLNIGVSHLQAVKDGMYAVVNEPGGTAYSTFSELPPLEDKICGKTGTAQTPPLWRDLNGNGVLDRDTEILREGYTAWFAGFAPYHKSKIAFAVTLEYVEGSGGKLAGPIAHEVVRICREMKYMD